MLTERVARIKKHAMPSYDMSRYGTRHDIPRLELASAVACRESLSCLVDQNGTHPPHGLGHQRHWIETNIECYWMELHELHVDEHCTGTGGECQPLSDRTERIRRMPVEAADATGGNHDA